MYNKIKAIDTDKICVDSLRDTKETIADLNAAQLFTGLRADGSEILPNYTPFTIELKKLKGQPIDRVTLRDTGAFYQAITTNITQDKVVTDSTDEKTAKLKKKYETSKGKLFGLNHESKVEYLQQQLRPAFKKKMEAATGLKLK